MANQASDDDQLLVGDAEREEAVARLRDACVEGRLTLQDFSERVDAAFAARRRGELRAVTRDLPVTSSPPALQPAGERIVAVLSERQRIGPWRAQGRLDVVAVMGSCKLDLRNAELIGGELTVQLQALMADVKIYVPSGVRVLMEETAVLSSSKDARASDASRVNGPLVRVQGFCLMSSVEVTDGKNHWLHKLLR